jgi:diguanylate cyclase (GGDEF)-like protein
VTFSNPSGPTWIRDASAAVIIATHDPVSLRNGDLVDVIGFPSAGDYGPILKSATIRKIGSGPEPLPTVTDADEASKGNEESQLIQLDGELVDSFVHEGVRILRLESGSNVFSANISELAALPKLSSGSKLRLTGICSVTTDDSQDTLLARGFRLNLRSAEDIRILQGGPWITSGRLAVVLSGTFALAMAALFWVVLLRRNVRKQTRTLLSKSVQLESANTLAHEALDRALETESLEQSRRLLLELIANNEPLDRIITDIARVAEKHSRGTSCSLTISLSDGSQLTAAPAIASNNELSFDLIPNQLAVRVPIFVGEFAMGVMVLQSIDGSALSQHDQTLFASWAQFASLAVERRDLYDSLSFRAQFDALTGLHNRASLYEKLGQALVAAKRNRTMLAVLYMDLNGFKEVNDTFGHDGGDRVLREVSKRILKSVRGADIVARLGGDEFVVVLTDLLSPASALSAAELLRTNLAQSIQLDSTTVDCRASVGVALYPSDGDEFDLLMKKADQRMYQEKTVGKLAPVTV